MFYDDCGNEFETIEDIKDFARNEFHNLDDDELADLIEYDDYVTIVELLLWIFKNDKEKFIKDYKNILKLAEDDYANNYFMAHDIEED